MTVEFHRNFDKLFAKLPPKVRQRFGERLRVFVIDPFDPTLRNHSLSGDWDGFRSINVTGDYRAVYERIDDTTVRFFAIGTHSQLYG